MRRTPAEGSCGTSRRAPKAARRPAIAPRRLKTLPDPAQNSPTLRHPSLRLDEASRFRRIRPRGKRSSPESANRFPGPPKPPERSRRSPGAARRRPRRRGFHLLGCEADPGDAGRSFRFGSLGSLGGSRDRRRGRFPEPPGRQLFAPVAILARRGSFLFGSGGSTRPAGAEIAAADGSRSRRVANVFHGERFSREGRFVSIRETCHGRRER